MNAPRNPEPTSTAKPEPAGLVDRSEYVDSGISEADLVHRRRLPVAKVGVPTLDGRQIVPGALKPRDSFVPVSAANLPEKEGWWEWRIVGRASDFREEGELLTAYVESSTELTEGMEVAIDVRLAANYVETDENGRERVVVTLGQVEHVRLGSKWAW